MTGSETKKSPLTARVAGQGALLFSGFAAAQAMSFARNAILGHALAKGDFGLAAALTLLLQMVEQLTDVGVDRLIVQAPDGDEPRFVATQHTALVLRGVLTAALLYLAANFLSHNLDASGAAWAFAAIAAVPLIKGFQHLDVRRAQRRLDNRPYLAAEIVPQAMALLLTLPVVAWVPNYGAVVLLSIVQAVAMVAMTHIMSERCYQLAWDAPIFKRIATFGWPIWLSALPLVAVYQGDRMIVGHVLGLEALASYSAAFLLTMVPGLIAAKIGHAVMLPVFAEARLEPQSFRRRFSAMSEGTAVAAGIFLAGGILLGGAVLELAFGPAYGGLGSLVACLTLMWSIRMLQAVPGMALMAAGETKPFLIAGTIRASALAPAAWLAIHGSDLTMIAAAGVAGEAASLAYVTWRMDREQAGFAKLFALRALFLVPCGIAAYAAQMMIQDGHGLITGALLMSLVLPCIVALALALFPRLLLALRALVNDGIAPAR